MSKTALITGASSGIGYEFAKLLAQDGYHTILVARSKDKLGKIQQEFEQFSGGVTLLPKDLAQTTAPQEIFDQIQSQNLQVDVLINNAGFGHYGEFVQTEWDKEQEMIQLNITALTHLTKLFLPGMVERKHGKIVNVASTASFQPGPLMAVYYATKGYVLLFSEAIANELQGSGVTVTALCPGPTQSGFQEAAAMEDSKLVSGRKLPTSAEVAEYGYKAMQKGKTVAVHGWGNFLMASSVRLAPRKMVANMVHKIQERK